MAGPSNPYSQSREPRPKRRRDESESPQRRPPRRLSVSKDRARRQYRATSPRWQRYSHESGMPKRSSPRRLFTPPHSPSALRNETDLTQPNGSSPRQDDRNAPSNTSGADPPKKRRRPGPSGGVSRAQREAHAQQAAQREAERRKREDEWAAQQNRSGIHEAVKEHYNLVPQRGREWRRTESKIKGLREFNNWIKSVMIQKFSPGQDDAPGQRQGRDGKPLLVLDIGCGKGGDLFKWQKAPQRVGLYVGIDPAEVSIQQARERYRDSRRKSRGGIFDAHFFAMDGYGKWLGEVPIIKEVGIDPNAGGRGNVSRWGAGGFDVVTMMFCMHYAFESEEKARGMLRNAAGALTKGGRFLGVIPSSDVIRSGLDTYYKSWERKRAAKKQDEAARAKGEGKEAGDSKDDQNEEHPDSADAPASPGFMPDSPPNFVPDSPTFAPESPGENAADSAEPQANGQGEEDVSVGDVPDDPEPQWGNSLYRVRFPPNTPKDGIFRPMFGWKYQFKLEEAVEEVPEYIVPFEGFRALAEEYNLEMTYCKTFMEIFEENREDADLGPLSVRMGVTDRPGGQLRMKAEEKEAASFYLGFCFVKV